MPSEGKTSSLQITKSDETCGKAKTKTTEKESIPKEVMKLLLFNISCFVTNLEQMENNVEMYSLSNKIA